MEDVVVSGVALNQNEAKVTIFKVPDKPGVASKIFKKIADAHINVDMIIQNKTETKTTDISFTVAKTDLARSLRVMRQTAEEVGAGRLQGKSGHLQHIGLAGSKGSGKSVPG